MPNGPRPATRLAILAGVIINGADGHYAHITRAPAGYEGPIYLPVPVASSVGDRICISYAVTPPDPIGTIRRRIIDMRGAPSRPGAA